MERIDFADLVAKNRRWTWVLLGASFLLLAVVSLTVSIYLGGGVVGVIAGIAVAMALTFVGYAGSDRIALAATHAREADPTHFAQLHNLVEQMAIAAGIPKPKVYVVHDPAPNAFATGRNPRSAAVAVTTGLLEKLDRDELEGVLAHELAHIRNYDTRVMTVAVATAGSVAVITDVFWRLMYFGALGGRRRGNDRGGNPLALIALVVVAIFAPIAAALLKAAISRKREALADASAVAFTRYPTGLRRALEKLDADSTVIQRVSHATSHLWIESPDDRAADKKTAKLNEMFNTHPPLRERINILRAMEGLPEYLAPEADILADLDRRQQQRMTDPRPAAAGAVVTAARPTDTAPTAASTMNLEQIGHHDPTAFQPVGSTGALAGAPAGWYLDPSGQPHTLRYWDGDGWTKHTARR
ncbi:MAG TPA: M48 family metalloprotease [Acidimicrobiales bacterium]|nr:M48 family metalloprotease [Acidimicrobiales bacterium]